MPDNQPEMPSPEIPPQSHRSARPGPVRGIPAEQEYDRGPAPPEQSNRDHPGAVGQRRAVPGEGIVHSDADTPGVPHPQNVPDARLKSPGAQRPGTTDTGPEGVHGGASVGSPAGALDNETPSDGGKAPLSVPRDNMGPPAGAAANESAAQPPARPRRRASK